MGIRAWFDGLNAEAEASVRSEIWRLGNRYRGQPLEGAREELQAPGIAPDRARLLRACVRRLQVRGVR